MPRDVNPDVRTAYGLDEWSPEALDRLRRFVSILVEWHAVEVQCARNTSPAKVSLCRPSAVTAAARPTDMLLDVRTTV
jgi:hypothetical protein